MSLYTACCLSATITMNVPDDMYTIVNPVYVYAPCSLLRRPPRPRLARGPHFCVACVLSGHSQIDEQSAKRHAHAKPRMRMCISLVSIVDVLFFGSRIKPGRRFSLRSLSPQILLFVGASESRRYSVQSSR